MKGRLVDSTHDDEGLVRRCVLEFARPHNWGKPAVFVAVLLLAGAARAQSIAPSATTPNAAAEQLFAEGRALLDAGQYAAACPKLAESQRLDPTAGTLLNLANCYEKNGQTASAWGTFKEASRSAIDRHRPDWERIATKRATALEPKLSRLTVAVPLGARVAGLTITAGALAVEPPMFDTAIPLDPGRIFVTARAPLHKTWTGTIDLGTNADRRTIAIPLLEWEPVAGPTVMPALRPNPPLSRREVRSIPAASWILGATALAAAGGGVALWVVGRNEKAALDDGCGKVSSCAHDDVQASRSKLVAGDVLVGSAIALFASGIVVGVLTHPHFDVTVSPRFVSGALRF